MKDREIFIGRRQALKRLGALVLAIPVLSLSACQTSRETGRYLVKIQVERSETFYSPSYLNIAKGSEVVFQNISIYPQTATCDPSQKEINPNVSLPADAQPWDSGALYPGQTWSYAFNNPGTYIYFSRYSRTPGAAGIILVGE